LPVTAGAQEPPKNNFPCGLEPQLPPPTLAKTCDAFAEEGWPQEKELSLPLTPLNLGASI